jgi:type I restriction enzyme R subunit
MTEPSFHPEDRARSVIDRQLAASGWLIQSKQDMNLGEGSSVAIREFPTDSGRLRPIHLTQYCAA